MHYKVKPKSHSDLMFMPSNVPCVRSKFSTSLQRKWNIENVSYDTDFASTGEYQLLNYIVSSSPSVAPKCTYNFDVCAQKKTSCMVMEKCTTVQGMPLKQWEKTTTSNINGYNVRAKSCVYICMTNDEKVHSRVTLELQPSNSDFMFVPSNFARILLCTHLIFVCAHIVTEKMGHEKWSDRSWPAINEWNRRNERNKRKII